MRWVLGRIEETFAQSVVCTLIQMKIIIQMSKLGFTVLLAQLKKWRFRDVVGARALQ